MDILNLKIVKQPNGKYAVWNEADKSFDFTNKDTAEEIKAYYVNKVDRMLTENIRLNAMDDSYFNFCVETYKIKHGLDSSEKENAAVILEDMGVSVQGL